MVRPDWICEILSTNKRNDLIKKKRVYHRHQVPHYRIVDPSKRRSSVYRWAPDGYTEILVAERGEVVRAEPFDAIPLTLGVIFGDDEDEERALSAPRVVTPTSTTPSAAARRSPGAARSWRSRSRRPRRSSG